MAIPFPTSPVNYQIFKDTTSGSTWMYDISINSWSNTDRDIYDFPGGVSGIPTANEVVAQYNIVRPVVLATNFEGSYWNCSIAPSGQTTFKVQVNGSLIGSIIFAASSTTATFTSVSTGPTTIAAGSILTITAPSTPDFTLANASGTLAGYLLYIRSYTAPPLPKVTVLQTLSTSSTSTYTSPTLTLNNVQAGSALIVTSAYYDTNAGGTDTFTITDGTNTLSVQSFWNTSNPHSGGTVGWLFNVPAGTHTLVFSWGSQTNDQIYPDFAVSEVSGLLAVAPRFAVGSTTAFAQTNGNNVTNITVSGGSSSAGDLLIGLTVGDGGPQSAPYNDVIPSGFTSLWAVTAPASNGDQQGASAGYLQTTANQSTTSAIWTANSISGAGTGVLTALVCFAAS